jgi:hypothetical protein
MSEMVKAWADAVADGREALLVAYHRDSVEALNQAARKAWDKLGELSGPELEAPGGRSYRAGDRVITLVPGPGGAWVTSQRAAVVSVEPGAKSLVARTPEGTTLHLGPEDVGSDKTCARLRHHRPPFARFDRGCHLRARRRGRT